MVYGCLPEHALTYGWHGSTCYSRRHLICGPYNVSLLWIGIWLGFLLRMDTKNTCITMDYVLKMWAPYSIQSLTQCGGHTSRENDLDFDSLYLLHLIPDRETWFKVGNAKSKIPPRNQHPKILPNKCILIWEPSDSRVESKSSIIGKYSNPYNFCIWN
jgi:hypothetical protein